MDISVTHYVPVSEHDKTKNEPEISFPFGGCRDPFVSQFMLHRWRSKDPQSSQALKYDPGDCCGHGTGLRFINLVTILIICYSRECNGAGMLSTTFNLFLLFSFIRKRLIFFFFFKLGFLKIWSSEIFYDFRNSIQVDHSCDHIKVLKYCWRGMQAWASKSDWQLLLQCISLKIHKSSF